MILTTVGTQLPFDRLIRAVDDWASANNESVFAQIGVSSYQPKFVDWQRFLDPQSFAEKLEAADVVVAHAGIGSIVSALECGKPVIVLPRLARYGEHRNDHQLATAKRFSDSSHVSVVFDERELCEQLDRVDKSVQACPIASQASGELIDRLRNFLATGC